MNIDVQWLEKKLQLLLVCKLEEITSLSGFAVSPQLQMSLDYHTIVKAFGDLLLHCRQGASFCHHTRQRQPQREPMMRTIATGAKRQRESLLEAQPHIRVIHAFNPVGLFCLYCEGSTRS